MRARDEMDGVIRRALDAAGSGAEGVDSALGSYDSERSLAYIGFLFDAAEAMDLNLLEMWHGLYASLASVSAALAGRLTGLGDGPEA